MRVLVACEYRGRVRQAFRLKGHDAWSCDLLESEDNSQYHIQGDVLMILEDGWDMLIAHPPCTYLASSGLHWNKKVEGREELTHEAMMFVFNLMGEGSIAHGIPKIALENPIGRISTAYRKPDQIIQPYNFGEDASKSTCLWLKGLPSLKPTACFEPRIINGKRRWGNQCDSGQNKLAPSEDRWKERSRTYRGIAEAMAEQWGTDIERLEEHKRQGRLFEP